MGDKDCDAGRRAYWGGKWDRPCENRAGHVILTRERGWDGAVLLCDTHFQQVYRAGLVQDPNVSIADAIRRLGPRPDQ